MSSALASLAVVLLVAPVLPGLIARTKAILTGRRGQPVLQLYADLGRLLRKGAVYGTATTWMFALAPVVVLATVLCAALLLPLDGRAALIRFSGDAVAFASVLALGRMALVLGAMDTGSSFEAMGASREATVASFAEPALFLALVVLAVLTQSLSLSGMLGSRLVPGVEGFRMAAAAPFALVAVTLFIVLLAETARVPVDDPATHLELTMIHEVMILDHSGPDLAFLLYAGAVKLVLFGSILVGVVVPRAALAPWLALGLLVGGLVVVAVLIGVIESVTARLRLTRVPQLLVAAATLAALGVILVLR